MATTFFPSCRTKASYPEASARLAAYVEARFGILPAGCCRTGRRDLAQGDTALVVCSNCAAILEESSKAGRILFVWNAIDADPDFPFPDYRGEAITVQDCWIAVERRSVQDAVRSLLAKMNFRVCELAAHHERTRFCGVNLLQPCNPSNAKLAPRRYVERGAGMFTPCPPAEQKARFRRHCQEMATDRAACYCTFCTDAVNAGGKTGVHLLNLLFPASK